MVSVGVDTLGGLGWVGSIWVCESEILVAHVPIQDESPFRLQSLHQQSKFRFLFF